MAADEPTNDEGTERRRINAKKLVIGLVTAMPYAVYRSCVRPSSQPLHTRTQREPLALTKNGVAEHTSITGMHRGKWVSL